MLCTTDETVRTWLERGPAVAAAPAAETALPGEL